MRHAAGFDDDNPAPVVNLQYPEDNFIDQMALGLLTVKNQDGVLVAGSLEGLIAQLIQVRHEFAAVVDDVCVFAHPCA